MRPSDCDGDRLVRARRGTLNKIEALALRTHLAQCPTCCLAQDVAEDFKQETADVTQDRALVLGMSEVAKAWAHQRNRRRAPFAVRAWRPVRVIAMAASLLLIAGTVRAFWLWRLQQAAQRSPNSWKTAPVRLAQQFAHAAPVEMTAAPRPTAPEPPPPSPLASVLHTSRPVSPALLLERATEARRRGDTAQAITLYRRLQNVFPASSEALIAAPPLGGLLLAHGATRPALEQFDRYLRAAPMGVLVPEALYGRGRALRALSETADEQRTWRRLVSAFPDSPYAPVARRRLADLQ